jgi:glyoxylase-like metal-dependent hydrolase (beta-lactamase superfamily II)
MQVKLRILEGGYCTHKEKMVIRGGRNQEAKFPSMFGLIIHPRHGIILYDTGYTARYYRETASFPFNIYAKLTPVFVKEEDTAVNKLKKMNIRPEDVKYIIISHFHADHIAALRDFPEARFIYMKDGYDRVKNLKGLRALRQGYLAGLLPDDFANRSIMLDKAKPDYQVKPVSPFEITFDYFGDETIKLIPLAGHYRGHLGALIRGDNREQYFMIADSCWLSKSFRENIMPHRLANIIMDNSNQYRETLAKIHNFHKENPEIHIIPSHCSEVFDRFVTP